MQKLPVYLYANLSEVTLDLDITTGIHQIMYQNPITIQKGIRTPVQLQFKNSDQKRVGEKVKYDDPSFGKATYEYKGEGRWEEVDFECDFARGSRKQLKEAWEAAE